MATRVELNATAEAILSEIREVQEAINAIEGSESTPDWDHLDKLYETKEDLKTTRNMLDKIKPTN